MLMFRIYNLFVESHCIVSAMCLLTRVSLSSSVTGVEIEKYRARIGSVLTRSPDMRAQQETKEEGAYWFLGLVLRFNVVNINC
jgi:hypothetical protein